KIGNDCINEFLELLEIPETREALLEFKEKIKIIFKDKIDRCDDLNMGWMPDSENGKNEYQNETEDDVKIEDEGDKIIHMNKNRNDYPNLLSEYEDREMREFIHYLLTFPFFRRMVLQEFYLKTKPFFKNKFDEYLKNPPAGDG
ncbi:MAG: hypothetical protein GY950_17730, partial [bacterium]|nr:hypothetical protein [bacterium]